MTKQRLPDADPPPPKQGNGKKLLVISVVALAMLGAGVGAGLYASQSVLKPGAAPAEDPNKPKLVERMPDEPAAEEDADAPQQPKVGTVSVKSDLTPIDPKKYEATYFPIEQNFTANLADGSGFVQVGLSLATYYDGKVIANLKRQAVPIRSAILMVLSDQEAAVLATPQGKRLLQRQLTGAINQVLREHEGFGGIHNVYFTQMVLQ